jgi:hypothetical protein
VGILDDFVVPDDINVSYIAEFLKRNKRQAVSPLKILF